MFRVKIEQIFSIIGSISFQQSRTKSRLQQTTTLYKRQIVGRRFLQNSGIFTSAIENVENLTNLEI